MHVIPVLDIKNATVVQAVGGQRAAYQPVRSVLGESAEPRAMIEALLRFYPFTTIYIADLDALENIGSAGNVIHSLAEHFSEVRFLLDAGFREPSDLASYSQIANLDPIIASETTERLDQYERLTNGLQRDRFILSLDHRNGRLGAGELFVEARLWPRRVIVMDLPNVGKSSGPNIDLIQGYQRASADTEFIAAGGVRNIDDIKRLSSAGINAALIATALHRGNISAAALTTLKQHDNQVI